MTNIILYLDDNEKYFGFESEGHAGFKAQGKDIVCSAISVLCENLVNSVEELTDSKYSLETNQKTGYMSFKVNDWNKDDVQLLFQSFVLGLNGIRKEYGKYLKLTNRRCKP